MTQATRPDAKAAVREMRRLAQHPAIAAAMAAGQVSRSYGLAITDLTRKLPAGLRARTGQILLEAAAGGADIDDLKMLAAAALEQWRAQHPDPDDEDGFEDRYLAVGTTFGGAGTIGGNLTPECATAVQAVLEALGKRHGPEDARTEASASTTPSSWAALPGSRPDVTFEDPIAIQGHHRGCDATLGVPRICAC